MFDNEYSIGDYKPPKWSSNNEKPRDVKTRS